MSSQNFGPRDELSAWSEKVADIMEEMLSRTFVPYRDSGAWQPATNVYEDSVSYYLCVELAGVAGGSVAIELRDATHVIIRGRRSQPRPAEALGTLSVHVLEIDEGPFCREVELPGPVDPRAVMSQFHQGYLWLTLPKIAA